MLNKYCCDYLNELVGQHVAEALQGLYCGVPGTLTPVPGVAPVLKFKANGRTVDYKYPEQSHRIKSCCETADGVGTGEVLRNEGWSWLFNSMMSRLPLERYVMMD